MNRANQYGPSGLTLGSKRNPIRLVAECGDQQDFGKHGRHVCARPRNHPQAMHSCACGNRAWTVERDADGDPALSIRPGTGGKHLPCERAYVARTAELERLAQLEDERAQPEEAFVEAVRDLERMHLAQSVADWFKAHGNKPRRTTDLIGCDLRMPDGSLAASLPRDLAGVEVLNEGVRLGLLRKRRVMTATEALVARPRAELRWEAA